MNTEERQLAEMLHRVTPEPPRRVDRRARSRTGWPASRQLAREPRLRRGFLGHGAWAAAGRRGRRGRHRRRQRRPSRRGQLASQLPAGRRRARRRPPPRPRRRGRPPSPSTTGAALPGTRHRRRPVGRGADQSPGVHPGLADRGGQLAVRGTGTAPWTGSTRPPGPSPRASRTPRRCSSPPVVIGNTVWVVWSYGGGNDRPARLRRPDARPGRLGAGARHRRRRHLGSGRAGRRRPTVTSTWPRARRWRS